MQVVEQAREYLERVEALLGDAHKEARKKLYDALPVPVRVEARRIRKATYFVEANAKRSERKEHVSPSGQYKLVIMPFATRPGSWNYTQGLVYRMGEDKPVAEVQRNYCQFPYAWVEGHDKGDFLLCGEDYQGQTVINLKTGARRDTLPEDALEGFGFCWVRIHPSPTGKLLCVDGCFWGAPYELRFFDFAEPMCPPWPELSTPEQDKDFLEWLDDRSARVGGFDEVYVPLNKSETELLAARRKGEVSEEDYDRYREDDNSWERRRVSERVWTCPTALESLVSYVQDTFAWQQKNDRTPTAYEVNKVKSLMLRATPAEVEAFNSSGSKALLDWAVSRSLDEGSRS